MTAAPTSLVPRMAAARRSSPSSRQREIDSRTTIEQSTSMPMPSARPPSDMMFRETPERWSGAKQRSSAIGMLTATIAVARNSRRKTSRTRTARRPPRMQLSRSSAMLARMKTERSATIWSRAPSSRRRRVPRPTGSPRPPRSSAGGARVSAFPSFSASPSAARTRSATATMLASASLKTSTCTLSPPSVRVSISRSLCARTTRPRSCTRTSRPSRLVTTVSPISRRSRYSLSVRTMYSVRPSWIVPPATLMFSCRRRSITAWIESPVRRSASSSRRTWISSSSPPRTRTAATPLIGSRARLTCSSASRRRRRRPSSPRKRSPCPESESSSTGSSEGS